MPTFEPNTVETAGLANLEEVDIFADEGIWVCLDEGCNSNCHGNEWEHNAEKKLAKFQLSQGFDWIHRREKTTVESDV